MSTLQWPHLSTLLSATVLWCWTFIGDPKLLIVSPVADSFSLLLHVLNHLLHNRILLTKLVSGRSSFHSNEGLMLETSALRCLCGANLILNNSLDFKMSIKSTLNGFHLQMLRSSVVEITCWFVHKIEMCSVCLFVCLSNRRWAVSTYHLGKGLLSSFMGSWAKDDYGRLWRKSVIIINNN